MRTLIMCREYADTYAAACGHLCSSMRTHISSMMGLAFAEAGDFGATNELREHLQQ